MNPRMKSKSINHLCKIGSIEKVYLSINTMSSPRKRPVVEVDGIKYKIDTSNKTASVSSSPQATGDLVIPETVTDSKQRTFKITDLSSTAFEGSSIKSIHFSSDSEVVQLSSNCFGIVAPSTLETLELPPKLLMLDDDWCFLTPNLKTIKLSKFNPNFILTDASNQRVKKATGGQEYLVEGCIVYNPDKTILYFVCRNVPKIIIPSTVKRIASSACQYGQLEEIEFEPNSQLEIIERSAFFGCKLKKIVNFPSSIKTIGDFAFNSNRFLESVHFQSESKLETIGSHAFESCNLTGRDAFSCPSSSITKIGTGCFESNKHLSYAVFPNAVTLTIHVDAFKNVSKRPLFHLVVDEKTQLKGKGIPDNVIRLNEGESLDEVKDVIVPGLFNSDDTNQSEEVQTREIDLQEDENGEIKNENDQIETEDVEIDESDKDAAILKLKQIIKEKDAENRKLKAKIENMKKILGNLTEEIYFE